MGALGHRKPGSDPPERFLMKTKGGPIDGETHVVPADLYGWPLPDKLPAPFEGGHYKKVNESKLPPMPHDSPVMRGAEYEWVAD